MRCGCFALLVLSRLQLLTEAFLLQLVNVGQVAKVKVHGSNSDFLLGILGDLHLDAADMEDHEAGRRHVSKHITELKSDAPDSTSLLVSLGDLGSYQECGTSKCFELAKSYLTGFGIPYSLITGNHDLEGIREFETDLENLHAWLNAFEMESHYWAMRVSPLTYVVGLSTTRFRAARYSSHEVFIDRLQVQWLRKFLEQHPEKDGWRVLVFTHAPIMGCGLRIVRNVHLKNGCCWVNHSESEEERRVFFRLCQEHRCIKAWFSGHFHLSHDYQDSICQAVGNTAFIQVGVMGGKSTRDGRRQSRIVKGDDQGLEVYTVNHHKDGELRLDVTIKYTPSGEDLFLAHGHVDFDHEEWVAAYTPQEADGCYLQSNSKGVVLDSSEASDAQEVCWWHMADGRVLGVAEGQVLEYDAETLAPLGVVCTKEQLEDKEIVVVGDGEVLMLVSSLEELEKQPLDSLTIIHPQEDGSYWRKWQRNKLVRQREKERERLAKDWLKEYREALPEKIRPSQESTQEGVRIHDLGNPVS